MIKRINRIMFLGQFGDISANTLPVHTLKLFPVDSSNLWQDLGLDKADHQGSGFNVCLAIIL